MATQTAIPESDRGEIRQSPAKPTPRKFAPRRFGERSWRLYRLQRTTELVEHVGGSPNPVQKGRLDRVVELEWELRKRVMTGDLSIKHRLELEKLIARYERELGLKPAAAEPPPLADLLDARAEGEDTARRALNELLKLQAEREREEAAR